MRWVMVVMAAASATCGSTVLDAGTGEERDPSCITVLFQCWDIGGACFESRQFRLGSNLDALCWESGACQLEPHDGRGPIMKASGGWECFRELPQREEATCSPGNCTYVYEHEEYAPAPYGRYELREFRDAQGAIVYQATCPHAVDPAPIPEDTFLAPIQWQEDALQACEASLP